MTSCSKGSFVCLEWKKISRICRIWHKICDYTTPIVRFCQYTFRYKEEKRKGQCLKISGSDPRPFHHITNTFLKECKPQFKEVIKICLNILFYSDTELWTQVILQFHRELQIRSNNWNIALWCICEMAGMCSDTTKTKSIAFCSQALAP